MAGHFSYEREGGDFRQTGGLVLLRPACYGGAFTFSLVGFLAIGTMPGLGLLAFFQALHRAMNYALSQPGATDRTAAEMNEMPVVGVSVVARILTHR